MVIDIVGLLGLVTLGAEAVSAVGELISILTGEPQPDYSDLTYEEKKALLRELTLIVVRLGLDVNCYPLGSETTKLYNEDGSPVYP